MLFIICLKHTKKEFALEKLKDLVDSYWAEISESIVKLESLSEDESFKLHKLAALIASKVKCSFFSPSH